MIPVEKPNPTKSLEKEKRIEQSQQLLTPSSNSNELERAIFNQNTALTKISEMDIAIPEKELKEKIKHIEQELIQMSELCKNAGKLSPDENMKAFTRILSLSKELRKYHLMERQYHEKREALLLIEENLAIKTRAKKATRDINRFYKTSQQSHNDKKTKKEI
jgi:hypothetical protein